MPEFLNLLPPDEARSKWLGQVATPAHTVEWVPLEGACGRVAAQDILSPQALPQFARSTVDGYAVQARDTYGAADTLPGYLSLAGEVPMGAAANLSLGPGQCATIHTGGMLPEGADSVVMLEYTQTSRPGEIEIQRSVAVGENTIAVGEDITQGQLVLERGRLLRPADIGGLAALGILKVAVAPKPTVSILSSGDEVVASENTPAPGQVRDINSHTLAALVSQAGGVPRLAGIIPDDFGSLLQAARAALAQSDMVLITAGSSASTRDMTASVIETLGEPGVIVHGINTRPGKPTILGAVAGKAVVGLPGNPVSALVNGLLFVVPALRKLLGAKEPAAQRSIRARLTINVASQAGREDWQPVQLRASAGELLAVPVFGKSNLIFTLANADGLIKIEPNATGAAAGDLVEVLPIGLGDL